jgi:DNA-binding NarL/FixJ family response regulator
MTLSRDIISAVVSDASSMGNHLLAEALERSCDRIKVLGAAHNVMQLMAEAAKCPSVILISGTLQDGPMSGFHALRDIHNAYRAIRPIMLLDARDRELVIAAFRAGAQGVFFRADPFPHLVKCIQCVHQGQVWAGSAELQFILEALTSAAPLKVVPPGLPPLTRREQQIAALVTQGLTNREISRRLNLSEHTVKNHLSRIFEKLGASNRVELVLQFSNRQVEPTA